jgi:magnesium transporter
MPNLFNTLNTLHLNDISNKEHSSYFFTTEDYTLLITRFFDLNEDGLIGISTPYLLFKEGESYKYNREQKEFELLSDKHRSIAVSVESQLERSEKLIMHYIDEIDKLEDDLYMRKLSPIFLDVWFDLKKDITRMERMLDRSHEALKKYIKYYMEEESFPNDEFANTLEHIERYQRLSSLNSNKLDTLYNYYTSLKNDKMNNNVYALTILSGIFLPLNLVVGFFGMNTENLFFSGDPKGTINVITILVALFMVFLILIPLIGLIERFILRRLLGRFNLYDKIINEIKKISLFSKD